MFFSSTREKKELSLAVSPNLSTPLLVLALYAVVRLNKNKGTPLISFDKISIEFF